MRLIETGLFVLSAGLFALTAGAQLSWFWPALDVFTHFAPLYLFFSLMAVLGALMLRRRRGMRILVAALGLTTSVGASLLILPEFTIRDRGPPVTQSGRFKVVEFNAWGPNEKAGEAYRWLLAQNADAVILVEGGEIPARMVREAGYFASCLSCGVTVLTKIAPVETYPPKGLVRDQPFLTSARIQHRLGQIDIVGLHRYWPVRLRANRTQDQRVQALLDDLPKDLVVLAGDLNATPWSFVRRRTDQRWGLLRRTLALSTWPAARVSHNRLPAPFPYLPIDHVYAGRGWATVSVERGPELGSDHYPVVVVLSPVGHGCRDQGC